MRNRAAVFVLGALVGAAVMWVGAHFDAPAFAVYDPVHTYTGVTTGVKAEGTAIGIKAPGANAGYSVAGAMWRDGAGPLERVE